MQRGIGAGSLRSGNQAGTVASRTAEKRVWLHVYPARVQRTFDLGRVTASAEFVHPWKV